MEKTLGRDGAAADCRFVGCVASCCRSRPGINTGSDKNLEKPMTMSISIRKLLGVISRVVLLTSLVSVVPMFAVGQTKAQDHPGCKWCARRPRNIKTSTMPSLQD